jgi:hypothetical protein
MVFTWGDVFVCSLKHVKDRGGLGVCKELRDFIDRRTFLRSSNGEISQMFHRKKRSRDIQNEIWDERVEDFRRNHKTIVDQHSMYQIANFPFFNLSSLAVLNLAVSVAA